MKKYNPDAAEISTKFDGVSLEIHYHNGILVSASTRGDKTVGDDVTENAKTIHDIPLKLKDYQYEDVYVRGEVLMPRSTLKRINENSK
jgi:DNA ligase (NAD+)